MTRLAVAFFCSGFGALLCQIVWQRMLGIFAGSDTVSAALVVGAFLMGLGLGSLIGARLADRLTPARALIGFALCEAGVAGFALVSKFLLYDLLAVGLVGVVDAPAAVFALCFAVLVVPTTLMGASLPLLARAVATSLDTAAERIGRLYGLNTLGAGAGALLGGWLLVGNLGFVGALVFAALLDLAAALLALSLAGAMPGAKAPDSIIAKAPGSIIAKAPTAAIAPPPGGTAPYGGLGLWCALVFLSGYVIVALEIVWVRMMGQVGQYSAYLFSTVLGIFLLADGLGIAVAARLVRGMRDPRPAFFATQAGGFVLAAALLLALWLAMPLWPLAELVPVDDGRLRGHGLLTTLLLTLLVVAPPSFLIGMTFPFVQRAVQQDLAAIGARVGWVQLANIAGNAAGSIGTGLVTLHLLGTAGTLRLLAALSLALMLYWLWHAGAARRRRDLALGLGCALVLAAMPGNAAWWWRLHADRLGPVVAWGEDRSGVVLFRDHTRPEERPRGPFFIQGFSQGRIPFLPIHLFLGAIGPLLHPEPLRVLTVGVGSGGTPWAAGVLPATREVRGIELVAPVLTTLEGIAAAHPGGPIAEMLRNPRWRLEYGDGRRALARAEARHQVIQADAILPEGSHSGLIYSREFLEQVRRRLAPGGLYVQWAPTRRVAETFVSVFPHAVLLRPAAVLVGSDQPIGFDPAALARRFAEPAVLAHLGRGNPGFSDWAAMFAEPALIWAPGAPRGAASLTDVFPRDEFYLNNPIAGSDTVARPPSGAASVAGR